MEVGRTRGVAVGALMVVSFAACGDDGGGNADNGSGSSGINLTTADSNSTAPKLDIGDGNATMNVMEGGSGCAAVSVSVEPEIPTIVLQVDQSGSMTNDFSGQQRWDALYETLMEPTGVVASLEETVRFGLALYSSMDGDEGGQCPMLTEVPPALNNFAAIDAVYAPAAPIDETPTGESHELIAIGLEAFAEPGPKAIVVATDGEPDTCAEPNPQNGQPEVITSVQNAFDAGIETYVISVGDEVGEPHLQEVANAGVGKDVNDPMPAPFYVALNAGDLVDAFQEIISGFISCEIPIDGIVDLNQMCEGTVLLDGVELMCPVDWMMLDPSTLELIGDACETFKDGQSHSVTASWPCGAVSIP